MRVSRRTLLAAAALIGCADDAAARRPTLHVAPAGSGDGTSWDGAAGLHALDDLISHLQPGGEVLIAADRGEYDLGEGINLAAGGLKDRVVSIRGVNSATGAPMAAVLRGARRGSEMGAEGFRLMRGASHLHFSQLDFRDVGNGCFRVSAPISDLTIEDCGFENIYRFLENSAGDANHASLSDFAVRRCTGTRVERGFLRVRYNSRNGLIEDCAAQGQANEGGFIPAGCALDDRASNITYRRCVMENFQQWRSGDYWNGDGFSDEPGNRAIRYESCQARGSTDGGFDCKSRDLVLENCIAEDNKRNFRVWSHRATLTGCVSRNPNFRGRDVEQADACHIWIGGEDRARVIVANLTIEDHDATAIFEFEHDDAQVEIRGVSVVSPQRNWGDASIRTIGDAIIAQQG